MVMVEMLINTARLISVLFYSIGKRVCGIPYIRLATAVPVTLIAVHNIALIKLGGFRSSTEKSGNFEGFEVGDGFYNSIGLRGPNMGVENSL